MKNKNYIVINLIIILLGLGILNIYLSLFLIFSLFYICSRRIGSFKFNSFEGFGLTLWTLYILFYFRYYRSPEMPSNISPHIDLLNYILKSFPLILFYLIINTYNNQKTKITLFISLTSGMLLFSLLNTFYTLLYLEPPYYGRLLHFYHNVIDNSPGTTILSSMLSIVMISLLNRDTIKSKIFISILIISIILSIFVSIVFVARTYFLVLFIISSLKLFHFLLLSKNELKFLFYILMFIFIIIVAISFPTTYFDDVLSRLRNGTYTIKMDHYIDYWQQVRYNFFQYPKSNYNTDHYWFHSFILDSHKTSGPYTAIIAYFIFFSTLGKGIYNIIKKYSYSVEYVILYIAFLPYLLTTIPWESSESQMMILYSGICALIYENKK